MDLIENLDLETEIIESGETYYREENIYVDEKLVKNKSLIRVEMNLIQFPIFSKNTKKKKNEITTYFFNRNKSTYIRVTPQAGDYIPGEMEEKIFIALMQLMKEKGMPKKIVVTASELKNKLKMTTGDYKKYIDKSLSRLASTNYIFNNTMYSGELGGVINDKIETSIFNIRTVSLNRQDNKDYRKIYNDKRIKEIYEIEFSEHFYKNILKKGYMVYDGDILLDINSSTARTLYMLIEKLRFDNLNLKIETIFLIKRIPLKYEKKSLLMTIKTLTKALNELKSRDLILDFKFIKDSTWEKSEIEIDFHEVSNIEKQDRFYDDYNDFRKMSKEFAVSDMEHSKLDHKNIDNEGVEIENIIDMTNNVLNLMPSKARELKTMPKTIKEAIEKYGYKKVEAIGIYMKKQKVERVRSYFIKALENDWAEDDIEIPNEPKMRGSEIGEKTISSPKAIEPVKSYDEGLYSKFESLPQDIQEGIENYTYREYIKECGMESKIQKIAFKGSRKKYICEFLEKYPEILDEDTHEKVHEEKIDTDLVIVDKERLKEYINEYISLYEDLLGQESDDVHEVKRKIVFESTSLFMSKSLTLKKLEEIIKKYLI